MRRCAIFVSILACLVVADALRATTADDGPSSLAADAFSSTVRPILAAKCFGCHGGKAPKAGLDLSRFVDHDDVLGAFRVWEKMRLKVEAGEMPPDDAQPLGDADRRTLIDWHRRTFVDIAPRPGPSGPRRLTRTEYRNTLSDLLCMLLRRDRFESFYNMEAGSIVDKQLPADPPGPSGFDNDASVLSLGHTELAKRLEIAEFLVDRLDSLPEARRAIFDGGDAAQQGTPSARARAILARFATRAFRRPVSETELAPFMGLFDAAYARASSPSPGGARVNSQGREPLETPRPRIPTAPPSSSPPPSPGGATAQPARSDQPDDRFVQSIKQALTAILISPKFLYRLETSRGSHQPYRIDDYELATRLSYFLWSTMPDDDLCRLAANGILHTPEVLTRQVERMLADPRSIALSENFGGQWLGYAELENPDRFRVARSEEAIKLLRSMYREPLLFFDDLVRHDRSLLELVDSRYTFINPTLGYHYGFKGYKKPRLIKDGGYDWSDPLVRVALDDPNRGGILSMAATLVLTSAPERTSPVRRGVWILDAILGQRPPEPPPNIPPLEQSATEQPLSLKKQMERHRSVASCARCHDAIDPLGLALENFGPLGEWRERDPSGSIDATTTLESGEHIIGPAALKALLVTKYREPFVRNAAERMLAYALGRAIRYSDRPTIDRLVEALEANDYRFSVLVKRVVMSIPFGYRED
jgi:cytochrome c553